MMIPDAYRKPFYMAVALHLALMMMLGFERSTKHPVLVSERENTPGLQAPQPEIVKAVSVDNQKLNQAVERLKREREQEQRAQINKQKALERQALLAKEARIKEQQHLAQLKEEANKIAIMRKKQALEEQKHLKELAEQKALETKRLKELQAEKAELAKEALEAKKQADLKKQAQLNKQAELNKRKAEEAAAKRAREAEEARMSAQNQARLSGVVDKYKALIYDAISRNWILPENVDSNLSSQFRIHLAPDGSILEVTLIRSSGDPLLDRSAQTAIFKAAPLPVPKDPVSFNEFRTINLTVRPEQVRG